MTTARGQGASRSHRHWLPTFALLLGAAALTAQPERRANPFTPFDLSAFEQEMQALGVDAERLAQLRQDVEEGSLARAVDDLLRERNESYDRAVGLAEDGDPRAALELTKVLASTQDARLRGHCRYHLGRVFLDADDPEAAAGVLAEFLRDDRNRTPLDGEVMFFYARAQADLPAPEMAQQVLRSFLDHFPNAPERYVSAALQQIAELEAQVGPLHEVADVMKVCERRIRKTDTGKDTQERQEQVISQLETILEEMIQRESQSGGPGGAGNTPASFSAAPPGESRIGNLGSKAGIADRWGSMQDRERDAVVSELRDSLPGHYKQMLEEYYRRLNAGRQ